MAQLYQFLASDGEIQPLHAVRGVLDRDGKAVNRYDKAPAPAQEGDAIAARLVTIALQQAIVGGTGRQLVADGLGRLQSGRQDRHQQRRPRQLVRRLDRRPPRGGLGRQRPERDDRPVRRHRRDAGVVGHLLAAAERAAAGRRQGPGLAVGRRQPQHRRRLPGRAPVSRSSPASRRPTSRARSPSPIRTTSSRRATNSRAAAGATGSAGAIAAIRRQEQPQPQPQPEPPPPPPPEQQ